MDILVLVKETLDCSVPLEIREAERAVVQREPEAIYLLGPADRAAVEQAVRLKELVGGSVVVATVGPERVEWSLRLALARGADRALHVCDPAAEGSDALATALILGRVARSVPFDLILCGNGSPDTGTAAVPAMLAELLDLPQITGAVSLDLVPGAISRQGTLRPEARGTRSPASSLQGVDDPNPRTTDHEPAATSGKPETADQKPETGDRKPQTTNHKPHAPTGVGAPFLRAQRRLERGNRQVVVSPLPAVVSVDASITEPRYVSVWALMAARQRSIERRTLADLGIAPEQVGVEAAGVTAIRLATPRPRPKKIWTPDASMGAADRLKLLMGGGTQKKASSNFIEGPAETVAGHIVDYLKAEKLI